MFILSAALAAALTSTITIAQATQAYPSKPITLIVPSAPGGQPDIATRLIATELTKQMGRPVVVDNRPGAAGIIGFEAIARAAADGYTFGFAFMTLMTNPYVFAKLPYDTERDFQAVVQSYESAIVLAVTPSLPVRSTKELIALARSNPGKLDYGSLGKGSTYQLFMELFKQMTGTAIVEVPYKGIQQAINDAMVGNVQIVSDTTGSILPHVKAGKLRALGVGTPRRSPALPEVPTIAEAGVPGYEFVPTTGFIVPARVPREIVVRLNAEINEALRSPIVSDRFAVMGLTIVGGTPEAFAQHLRSQAAKFGKIIKAAGIKPE